MSIVMNLYYTGKNGNALAFAKEMEESGIAKRIREEDGNERYDYFLSLSDKETVLLIDSWKDQEALDKHHASSIMTEIARLREKYDLHMRAERYAEEKMKKEDSGFIRR